MIRHSLIAVFVLLLSVVAHGADLSDSVDLGPLQIVAVQSNDTMKTLDTFARQVMAQITGKSSIDDHPALYTLMDMSMRPDQYMSRNIIKIKNVPLRQEFLLLESINDIEKTRIIHDGTVSMDFLGHNDVQMLLENAQATSIAKAKAVNDLMVGFSVMSHVCQVDRGFIPAGIIPPPAGSSDLVWHAPVEFVATPQMPPMAMPGATPAAAGPKLSEQYHDEAAILDQLTKAQSGLHEAWAAGDAQKVNSNIVLLAETLPKINPAVYPSTAKRKAEVIYNRLMKLTIPGAAFYFVAMVLFLVSARSGFVGTRLWALRLIVIGFIIHTIGIGIRWWLVGDIFPPIKNEFESVMFSAWFGVLVGMILEIRRSRGIFGAAAGFVGTLALVAIFTAPYVAGRDIGGEIGQVQGILMSYWLYIHVTMVTAAYALIGMGFMLSAWWLVRYYIDYGTLRKVSPTLLSSDGVKSADVLRMAKVRKSDEDYSLPAGGGALALGFAQTLGMMFFMPSPTAVRAIKEHKSIALSEDKTRFLAMLDQCNLVVLQLAFWVLGAGVVCGAIWADQSWGRPWGWDPKETFALVTWIVYLIVVHVRVATEDKAWWTAVLSVIGFFVMLFNWIGVNFFLVGLHSYA